MTPLYRHIIKDSWLICRSRLFVWPLALFASIVGIASTFQIFFDLGATTDRTSAVVNVFTESDFITSIFVSWSQSFNLIPWSDLTLDKIPVLLFFFLLLIFILAITVIIISSEGGLIFALGQLLKKKKTTFLACFQRGLDKFWQIFSINLIYRLLYLIILIIIILPLIFIILGTNSPYRLALAILVYIILVPAVIVLDLVARYSIMYIVLYNQSIKKSFANAWLLFRTNWVISVETALLILGILVVAFFIITSIFIPLVTLFLSFFGTLLAFSPVAMQLAVIIIIINLIAMVVVFVTIFTAFQTSIWVGVFQKITTGTHYSKIHRISRHLPALHKKTATK